MVNCRTYEQADKIIQKFKNMDENHRNSLKFQIKDFMRNRLKALNIEANEETIEKEFNKLC